MVSAEVLKGFNLFAGLDETELSQIAKLCQERPYEEGATIFSAAVGRQTSIF